ncbi:MAG: hypothetical protein HOP29_00375 [Phycisphaerales bacterium]|nr:hypothetical protein [Phycisphaerales bacterium]
MARSRPRPWALVAFAVILPPMAFAMVTQRFGWAAVGLAGLLTVRVCGFTRGDDDDDR